MEKNTKDNDATFMDGFREWLGSEESKQDDLAIEEIAHALRDAAVDVARRVITWRDGQARTIEESVSRLHVITNLPINCLGIHLGAWLDMHYEPEGLSEEELEKFEDDILPWVEEITQNYGASAEAL